MVFSAPKPKPAPIAPNPRKKIDESQGGPLGSLMGSGNFLQSVFTSAGGIRSGTKDKLGV